MAVPLRFPAADGGIGCQGLVVDVLGRKHGQVTGIGAEAGAVLADVCLRTGRRAGASARWQYPSAVAVTAASLASQRRLPGS